MFEKFRRNFFEIIFPKTCVGCGKEGMLICGNCRAGIRLNSKFSCPVCGKASPAGSVCGGCRSKTSLDGLLYVSFYGNPVFRQAIYAWKYSFVGDVGEVLGNLFLLYAEKCAAIFDNFGSSLIQAIPLHRRRLLWRGFNQAEALVDKLAGASNLVKIDVLLRKKKTIPQSEVGKTERFGNVASAFALTAGAEEKIAGWTVILIDDIYTSGATMEECAKLLKSAGAKEVWGFVLAKG